MPLEIKNNVKAPHAPLVAQPAKPDAAPVAPPAPNPFAAALTSLDGFLRSIIALLSGSLRFANTRKKGDGKKLTIGGEGHLLEFYVKNRSASTRYLQLFSMSNPADGEKPDREWTVTTLQAFDGVFVHGLPFGSGLSLVLSSQEGSLVVVTAADALLEATFRT